MLRQKVHATCIIIKIFLSEGISTVPGESHWINGAPRIDGDGGKGDLLYGSQGNWGENICGPQTRQLMGKVAHKVGANKDEDQGPGDPLHN